METQGTRGASRANAPTTEPEAPGRPRGAGRWATLAAAAALLLAAVTACGEPQPEPAASTEAGARAREIVRPHRGELSADAHPEVLEALVADLEAERHPADGAGRAWIAQAWEVGPEGVREAPRNAEGEPVFQAGLPARFALVFEAGPLGVAEKGVVFLQVSPFWEWDDPQPLYEDAPGYTTVATAAEGVELEPFLAGTGLLAIELAAGSLAAGDRVEIVYGAGPLGARVDRYAERGARLWVAVDGDGDGVRGLLADSPTTQILPRAPAHLVVTVPSTAEPGAPVPVTLAVVDGLGNAGIPFAGEVALEADPALELPAVAKLAPEDRGRVTLTARAAAAGVARVRARVESGSGPLAAESNPLVVRAGLEPVLWADLHGHSQLSDGTGTPDDYYDYARNVAALDVAALTDHDHWGMRFLDAHPEMWEGIRDAAQRHHAPGEFVTLLGYEWTSWLQGHRHVLYFGDEGEVLSSLDPRFQTPAQLWDELRGKPALTFAHHSAGGPISTNWTWAPPPDLEPVTEVASVHGSSESDDVPGATIYNPLRGNFVRDVLGVGYRFGFIGSGDSHDGHPGLAGIATGGSSGLAAIRASAKTRSAVLEALRARRTYATSGPRIFLDARLETGEPGAKLRVEVAAVAPVERVDFVRTGLVASVSAEGRRELELERDIPALAPGEFLYVRVVQEDGGMAWSSPFYGPRPER